MGDLVFKKDPGANSASWFDASYAQNGSATFGGNYSVNPLCPDFWLYSDAFFGGLRVNGAYFTRFRFMMGGTPVSEITLVAGNLTDYSYLSRGPAIASQDGYSQFVYNMFSIPGTFGEARAVSFMRWRAICDQVNITSGVLSVFGAGSAVTHFQGFIQSGVPDGG